MIYHTAIRGKNRERVPVKLVGEWDALDAELKRLWHLVEDWRGNGPERLTRAEIGRRLGVTENAIVGRLNRTDLPRREKPHSDTPGNRNRRGEYQRRKAKRLADALLRDQEDEMARIDANPVRQPHIVERIRAYVAQPGWARGKPGNKDIADLLSREFQLIASVGQIAGALMREGISRGGPKTSGGATGLERAKVRTAHPTPAPLPRMPSIMPAVIARASGNVSQFDNHTYRAPRQAPTPMPYRRSQECCWPIGEPGTRGFRYCDAPHKNKSYCDEHEGIAFVKVRDRREDYARTAE